MVKKVNKTENSRTSNVEEHLDIEWTFKETAIMINETPSILRNWFKELKDYIPHRKNQSGYNVFNKESLERLKEIKSLIRDQNWSVKQIEHYYATGGEYFKPEPDDQVGKVIAEEMRLMREQMQRMQEDNQYFREAFENQREFNQVLVQQLEEQNKRYFQKFDENMRALQETKKLMIEEQEAQNKEQKKDSFFARLFNR